MQLFFDNVQDTKGNAIVDANVIVTNYPSGTTAIIYDENDAIPANEITNLVTDAQGQYQFFAPNGRYSITIKKNTITLDEIIDFEIAELVGGGGVQSVTADTSGNILVNNADPQNPVVDLNNTLEFPNFLSITTNGIGVENVIDASGEPVIVWEYDGTDTRLSFQHNGTPRLDIDENGILLNYAYWPIANGDPGQVLTADGLNQLTWETPSSGGGVDSVIGGANVTITGTATDPVVNVPFIGVENINAGDNVTITGAATNPVINVPNLGPDTFLELDDTPANYTGFGLQSVRVNAGETGLQFAPFPDTGVASVVAGTNVTVDNTDPANPVVNVPVIGAEAFTELTDTPADYTGAAGQAVVVNGGESGLEFIPFPASGIDIAQDGVVQAAGATEIDFLVNFDVSLAGEISHKPDADMVFDQGFDINFGTGGSIRESALNRLEIRSTNDSILIADQFSSNFISILADGVTVSNSSFGALEISDVLGAVRLRGTNLNDHLIISPTTTQLSQQSGGQIIIEDGTGIHINGGGAVTMEAGGGATFLSATWDGSDTTVSLHHNGADVLAIGSFGFFTENVDHGFFGAVPVTQPILTSGTQQELTAALGSTSGLGLVDDSAAAAWVPVVTTPEVVDSNNSNSYAPVNPQRTVTYLIDTLTDGAQTTHMQPDDWEPGDVVRFVDYESNFGTASFTIDFETHNFEGTGSATLVMSVDDGAITLEYIDVTRGFQRVAVV